MGKNRSFAFVIPGDPGQDTAIRVKLASLHHPAGPPNAPDFTALEGQIRYLNSFRDGADNPVFDCPDSPAFGTTYTCAVLGCEPEYRDWVAAFDGDPVHVFGSAVVPSSEYAITHLAATCAGNEAACTDMWAELFVTTERWGNVDNTPALSAPNAVDLGLIVSKVKDVAGALIEPRAQLQPGTPDPLGDSLSALDIARGVDSVQGDPYPFTIDSCP
jgi:hypothetical protein